MNDFIRFKIDQSQRPSVSGGTGRRKSAVKPQKAPILCHGRIDKIKGLSQRREFIFQDIGHHTCDRVLIGSEMRRSFWSIHTITLSAYPRFQLISGPVTN